MTRFRLILLLTGLSGLLACGLLAAISAWLVTAAFIEPPLPYQPLTLLLVLILGGFSLAEIPMMVFTMRRLTVERPSNQGIVWGLNALYVCFAAVYGVPVLLLTGSVSWGLGLCGLGLVRLAASQILVCDPSR